jgi:Tol biopolymer transport system component
LPKQNPTLSPDGKLIAFIGLARTGPQLFLYDSVTDQIKQLTYKPGNTYSPRFVSNTEILFGSDRDKDKENELYLLDLSQPFEEKKKK